MLRNRPSKQAQMDQMAKEFEKMAMGPMPTATTSLIAPSPLAHGTSTTSITSPSSTTPSLSAGLFSNLANYITFNPQVPLFNSQPQLKRIVHIAIDRAIREIITP